MIRTPADSPWAGSARAAGQVVGLVVVARARRGSSPRAWPRRLPPGSSSTAQRWPWKVPTRRTVPFHRSSWVVGEPDEDERARGEQTSAHAR